MDFANLTVEPVKMIFIKNLPVEQGQNLGLELKK